MNNVVLIGVSDRSILWRHAKIKEEKYQEFVKEYSEFLADKFENIIITPDDGIYTDIADEFSRIKKQKAIAFYPDNDKQYRIDHIKKNFDKYETKPIKGDWYKLNAELTKQASTIICLGFSPGVLIELSYIKYHQKYGSLKDPNLKNIKILIDKRCIEQELPKSFEEQINNIHYFDSFEKLSILIKQN